jgi:hypothetical protein
VRERERQRQREREKEGWREGGGRERESSGFFLNSTRIEMHNLFQWETMLISIMRVLGIKSSLQM